MGTGDRHRESSLGRTLMTLAAGGVLTLGVQRLLPTSNNALDGVTVAASKDGGSQAARLAELEQAIGELRIHARALRQQKQLSTELVRSAQPKQPASSGAAASTTIVPSVVASPPPTQRWSWTGLVMNAMRPFEKLNGGITLKGLRLAEQKCKISTWCHRAQVIGGRLYITDLRSIFFDRHYAMARVMPLLLALKRFPVPDIDAVFSGTDYPIMEIPRDAAHMQRMYGKDNPIPPVFSPTANTFTHDIPWPDFSFFPPPSACGKPCVHPLKTPRWQDAHPQLLELGRKLSFDEKIDRAVFTGNMKTSPNRRYIFNQAEHHPELLFVNEVSPTTRTLSLSPRPNAQGLTLTPTPANISNGLLLSLAPNLAISPLPATSSPPPRLLLAPSSLHPPAPLSPLRSTSRRARPRASASTSPTSPRAASSSSGADSRSRSSAVTSTCSTSAPTDTRISSSTSS